MTRVQITKIAAVTACSVLLLTACSKAASSAITSATGSALGTGIAVSNACNLLTKAQVAAATGNSVDFSKAASHDSVKVCSFASVSGQAIALSVGTTPASGLTGDIPGFGSFTSKYHLTQVSGIGDQAYAGSSALIASKGSTLIVLVDVDINGGNHEQALETMAKDVFARV